MRHHLVAQGLDAGPVTICWYLEQEGLHTHDLDGQPVKAAYEFGARTLVCAPARTVWHHQRGVGQSAPCAGEPSNANQHESSSQMILARQSVTDKVQQWTEDSA